MEYRVIRSDRRTLAVEIERDGSVLVRAPKAAPTEDIDCFVEKHSGWIEVHRKRQLERLLPPFSAEEERALRARAACELPARTARFAEKMGITYTGVRITSAKQRLGSCSSSGGISFSFRLMQYPDEVIDYVVVHELAHRKEMNHSRRFYAIVARYLPDYRRRVALLKSYPRAL